jgi:hypothetical protein
MTARQSGGGQHNKRSGVENTTQGDWAADGTTEGGGDNACTLVVDSFWQWWERRGCTQDVLEIVPQYRTSNRAKKPSENWVFRGGFYTI